MFGDCHMLSTMGGNNAPSDSLYSPPIPNPASYNFMANMPFNMFPPPIVHKDETALTKNKEEMDSGASGSEPFDGISGNEQDQIELLPGQTSKKKRYHRHTARQIHEMEALFKENPHPDDKQRMRLSQDLGLKPRQVKFWFQNRRTQMKAQQDRTDNAVLRADNESLKNENYRLQAAIRNIICPNCGVQGVLGEMGFDEQQLRLENARLKDEIERMCSLLSQYSGTPITPAHLNQPLNLDMNMFPGKFNTQPPMTNFNDHVIMPMPPFMPETPHVPTGGLILEEDKPVAMDLAISSMNELLKMLQLADPLWVLSNDGKTVLNVEEYERLFPWPMGIKPQCKYRVEASRETAVIIMNSITLVDAFLDANKWMELFPSVISRAKTLQVVASGVSGNANGTLLLMYAELQALSPLIPTRETHFLRYCQQNAEDGSWVIVDFPLENSPISSSISYPYYKRKPSGCIIQDIPNGYSKVTWVEHSEVEDNHVHQIYDNIVRSGMAFGAKRWLSVLQRQCERFASLMARNTPELGAISTPEARKSLINLGQRMIRTFSTSITPAYGQSWTALSDSPADTVRITTRKIVGPGQPNGLMLTAVSTTWLPFSHVQVFDFLRDEQRRAQMDLLSTGNSLQEVVHIANGSHPGNCISLCRINVASNSSQRVELMLQESCMDDSGCLVVYATVDVEALQLAMNGGDTSRINLLPLGFVIVPVGPTNNYSDNNEGQSSVENHVPAPLRSDLGCLLTVGLQVLTSSDPTAKLNLSSVNAINNHLGNTVQQIHATLGCGKEDSGGGDIATPGEVVTPEKNAQDDSP